MSVVALDIGTSRIKALLANWDGAIRVVRSAPTPVVARAGLTHEFPADAVRTTAEALITAVAAASPGDPVDTLVFSCLGTAMVPLDGDGRPLGAALSPAEPPVHPDAGAPGAASTSPHATLFDLTGQDVRLSSFLLHWLWWRDQRPAVMRTAPPLPLAAGFLVAGICGADAEDPSWASRTMLMDLATDAWSGTMLAAADLPADVLPPILRSTTSWPVDRTAGARLGLAGTPASCLVRWTTAARSSVRADSAERRLVNIAGTYEHMAGVGGLPLVREAAVAVDGLIHRYLLPGTFLSYSRVPAGAPALGGGCGEPRTASTRSCDA